MSSFDLRLRFERFNVFDLDLNFKLKFQSFLAGNVESRNNIKSSELSIDKPFLFYVRDIVDDIILAAGKIVEIPVEPEIPLTFNN